MPWPVVHTFLRISTHGSILPHPLSPTRAIGVVEQLFSLQHVIPVGEDVDFWAPYSHDLRALHLRGNLIPDAHIAALLKQEAVTTLYSRDRDFLRFKGFRVVDPLA